MKYPWTIILSSFVLLFLFYSCNDSKSKTNYNEKKLQSKIILTFVDSITKQKLDDFEFGVSNDRQELPISFIINMKNDFVI